MKVFRHLLPKQEITFGQRWVKLLLLPTLIASSPAYADSEEDSWARTVSRVADSVVSLQLAQLRAFDDSAQGNSSATGFIVDAERGIVLTNRHVVGSGPIRISATFQNQERVDAVPLYRDPIHDFGFVRFDPKLLEYSQPASLALRPDKARSGMNIRVIGSDGGEQLSILPGTIARLDREVPTYARYAYNDFNTFYMQAASGTSGGSSGSPVIDLDGDVVALNAAANILTASSFFLPLYRIQHALEKLQADEPISRGSFQTLFSHQPFRQLRRLGLDDDTEQQIRQSGADVRGMLTVSQVIPGGVAEQLLESGDILVSVAGTMITDFITLEATLDDAVNERLSIEIIRQGTLSTIDIDVADLHALAPQQLLELGDAVLQEMSIQHARAMNKPQRGVVVMEPGYTFTRASVPKGALITEVEGRPITDLKSFVDAINATKDILRKRVRYIVPGREFSSELAQFQVDNTWFGHRLCSRVDDERFWDCQSVELESAENVSTADIQTSVPVFRDPLLDKVAPAMVKVDFSIPYAVENVYARNFKGVGLVVDALRGIVSVDRNTVPVALGDVELTFFGATQIPGRVVFVHPRHNIALIQYDTELLGELPVEALKLSDAGRSALPDELSMVGYRADGTFRSHPIDDISALSVNLNPPGLARFQQAPIDLFGIPNVPPSLGGPLVDADGTVHAVYMSFAYEEGREIQQREWAMPASVVRQTLELFQAQEPYHSLDIKMRYRPLYTAQQLGLPSEWLARYNKLPAEVRRVIYIEQVVPDTHAAEQLRSGDLLIAIDEQLVSDLFEAENLAQQASVNVTVLRDGKLLELTVRTSALDPLGTQRVISWAGANFQAPFIDIAYQKNVSFPGVYIADTKDGSPALWDGLYRNRFVIAMDDKPINTMDEFLDAAQAREQDQITRLTLITMSGQKEVVTVQPEYNFWPTFEVRRSDAGWERIDY